MNMFLYDLLGIKHLEYARKVDNDTVAIRVKYVT